MAHVLIIHSSLTVRVLLELELAQLGHQITTDGSAADVAIVEDSDPRSVARTRVLRERNPDLPIIVAASDEPSDHSLARAAGHLESPYSAEDLQDAIRRTMSATSA